MEKITDEQVLKLVEERGLMKDRNEKKKKEKKNNDKKDEHDKIVKHELSNKIADEVQDDNRCNWTRTTGKGSLVVNVCGHHGADEVYPALSLRDVTDTLRVLKNVKRYFGRLREACDDTKLVSKGNPLMNAVSALETKRTAQLKRLYCRDHFTSAVPMKSASTAERELEKEETEQLADKYCKWARDLTGNAICGNKTFTRGKNRVRVCLQCTEDGGPCAQHNRSAKRQREEKTNEKMEQIRKARFSGNDNADDSSSDFERPEYLNDGDFYDSDFDNPPTAVNDDDESDESSSDDSDELPATPPTHRKVVPAAPPTLGGKTTTVQLGGKSPMPVVHNS